MEINLAKSFEDGNLENETAKLSYLNLVTENLRSNNKRIARNSFWMVLTVLLYLLVRNKEPGLKKISILFFTIDNSILILNIIPVFFAFIFLQNVALWNNNINLIQIFEKLAREVYNLGLTSDTNNVIKPFSLTHHVINYQYENKRIKKVLKLPVTLIFIIIMLFPTLFIGLCVYQIIVNNVPSFIPVACGILSSFLGIAGAVQAFSSSKN